MAEGYEERADQLEKEADVLEDRGKHVEGAIEDSREDWESKKSSSQAPGAADAESAAPGGLGDDDEA